MRMLVRELLPQIAANVGDAGVGLCTPGGTAEAIAALSMAAQSLHKRIDDDGTLTRWIVPAVQGCFALPQDCLEGRQFFVDGFTATAYDKWYEGTVCGGLYTGTNCCYGPSIIDLGEFALPHPAARVQGCRLAFVAQSDADTGKEIHLQIINQYGEPVQEIVTLLAKQVPAYTQTEVYDLSFLQKPQTESNVKCYQVYGNGQRFFICDYEPNTRVGSFRRKRMPQNLCRNCNVVSIIGKRRFIPLENELDICPFDDAVALSFALNAIAALRNRDAAEYNVQLQFAVNEIYKQMRDADSPGNVARVKFRSGFSCNPSQAANRPMPGTNYRYYAR